MAVLCCANESWKEAVWPRPESVRASVCFCPCMPVLITEEEEEVGLGCVDLS